MDAAGPEHVRLERSQLRRLEVVSLVEATTLIFLVGVAVPLKHFAGEPAAVTVMGPVHGRDCRKIGGRNIVGH